MNKDSSDVQDSRELQHLIRQKEASIQAKGRLIDNMAYQIRTLSNAVIGFSDLLMSEKLAEELNEYVQEINQAGNGLSALVNEVLDWARLESGRLQVGHTRCGLANLIGSLDKIVSSSAADKGLEFQLEVDPDLPSEIISDQDRLLKCLINLAANAFKYTHQGHVRIRVLPEVVDDKPCIRFDVIDSGVGMTAEQMEHIFEPALRAEDANNEVLTMLDMGFTVTAGLPLTRQLIELLGGTLTVRSEQNVGSTFSLVLPTENDPAQVGKLGGWGKPANDTTPTEPEEKARPVSVLLVEDQQSNRMVISLMLEALGVSVETAEDGQDGAQKALEKDFDLILMDLKMPRMDGYQSTAKIREGGCRAPIVALSAKVLGDQENRDINNIFDGYLTKPVDSHKLSETIKSFVSEQQHAFVQQTGSNGPSFSGDPQGTVTFEYGK